MNTFVDISVIRAVGSFFMVGGWVKMLATMVGWWRKIKKKKKKKHWLKHFLAVSQKRNLGQIINDSKSHIWNCFLKMLIRTYNFFTYVPVDIVRVFFNFRFSSRKSQSQQNLAKRSVILQYGFTQNTSFPANGFLFVSGKKKSALHHFLTPKSCTLQALWKQMSVYFCISP